MTEPRGIRAYVGLGSNLDDPIRQVRTALEELATLPQTQLVARSSLYRSDPVGPQDQPDFVNAVACLETELPAHDLLDELQRLEQHHHRIRRRHWGPRTLDLDLLLFGDQTINSDRLQVPHPWMAERAFVLYPLAEIAPTLELPGGTRLSDLLPGCPLGTLERLAAYRA